MTRAEADGASRRCQPSGTGGGHTVMGVTADSQPDSAGGAAGRPWPDVGGAYDVTARTRLLCCLCVGVVVGVAVSLRWSWQVGILIGWMAAALVFLTWIWITIWPMDAPATASHAAREDSGRALTDVAVLVAAVASLGAVGLFLAAGSATQVGRDVQAGMSVVSIALAWAAVHTIFTVRYARLYYTGPVGGVDFNEQDRARYSDFAYLAFTIGMTYQVSDTDLSTRQIRATALRHALLSYLFGAIIIAAAINLVAGLAR